MSDVVMVPLEGNKSSVLSVLSVLVVIVNYRTGVLAGNCLHSLATEVKKQKNLKMDVVVVDNDSEDDSVEYIQKIIQQEGWHNWVTLIKSGFNGGFSFGNNIAIRPVFASSTLPRYVYLLNPDTQVFPDAIQALVDFLEAHPTVGIAGSALSTKDGTPWPYAFRFPNILSELERGMRLGIITKLLDKWIVPCKMGKESAQVDWLPGASMMIRREVFDSAGLMDESYFLYFEETDFCLQAQRTGWQCWYVPESKVMHVMGQSTGVTAQEGPAKRLPQYWFESRRKFFIKNHGLFYTIFADLAWMLGHLSWCFRLFIQRKTEIDTPYLLEDFMRNSVLLGKGLNK